MMIKNLLESEIDKEYMAYLDEFGKVLANVKREDSSKSQAITDVYKEVEKLRLQVCSRVRQFILTTIKNLAYEKTNFQIV